MRRLRGRNERVALQPERLGQRFQYRRDVLPGGLRVVTVQTPHLHTAMIAIYVRTGSRHETPRTNGVSHFLEHLFFRGSARYPDSVRMNAVVEEVGGNLNGVTTRDHGYYYTPIHPEHVEVGLEILGDMLTRPRLTQMGVERKIILEEMLDEVDERGRDIDLDNLSKRALFGEHPLALKIAGTRETVKALSLRQVKAHLARHYVTGNLVVTVAGAISRERVLETTARALRHLPEGAVSTEQPPPPWPKGPWLELAEHGESQTEFRLNFPAVPEHHPDFAALQLLRRVLDDGLSSRLPFEIVERRGLAYSVHAGIEPFSDGGIFELEAACAPERASKVVEEMCRTLSALCEKTIPHEELARAKRRHRMSLDFSQDSPAELAGWFGGTEIFRPPESFDEKARQVDEQTPRHIRDVANRYFRKSTLGVVAVGQRRHVRALQHAVRQASGLPE